MSRATLPRWLATALLIAPLAACTDRISQPVAPPQLGVQQIRVTSGVPTMLFGLTSPIGLPAPKTGGGIGILATTTFVRFARSPGEGGGFVETPVGGSAYFRDVAFAAEAVLHGDADGDYWDADIAVPGGSAVTFPKFTYRSMLNGEDDCWVAGLQSLCGTKDIYVSYILGIQCLPGGVYTFHLNQNGALAFQGSVTLKPTLPPGTWTNLLQTSYPNDAYNTLCYASDSSGTTHECPAADSSEKKVAIRTKGCALTAGAMVLSYFGVNTDPKALNDYLVGLPDHGGYLEDGGVNWQGMLDRAAQDNVRLKFTNTSPGTLTHAALRNRICRFGPQIVQVKSQTTNGGTHFVMVTGMDSTETDFQFADPANSIHPNQPSLARSYGDYQSVREFEPTSQPTSDAVLMAMGFSPIELLATDPLGRLTGYDPARGTAYSGIPASSYDSTGLGSLLDDGSIVQADPLWKELYVHQPVDGDYTFTVTGTASGTYTLDLLGYDTQRQHSTFVARDVPIARGEVHQYLVHFTAADMSAGTLSMSGGFNGGGQRTAVNALLSYARPGQSRTSLPAGTSTYPLMIFYDAAIDPATFQAELSQVDVTSLFHPAAATGEIVSIPLQAGRNVLKLSVTGSPGGRTGTDRDQLTFLVP